MKLFNSLTRKLEKFTPIKSNQVGVYTCGPTVYNYVSIGNWRTYFLSDILIRTLQYFDYNVHFVMNITDVGHLTGDNLGDADTGEDRLEKRAKKEGKTAWQIAKFYTKDFEESFQQMHMIMPTLTDHKPGFCSATQHIKEQIKMVKNIENKGLTYRISDGIYFDVSKYEAQGHQYGQLSNIDQVKEGARVEPNPEKKDPRDFALWKFSYPNGRDFDADRDDISKQRQMQWSSPWGLGFPGWHIECSAMSTKYLGNQFDIHIGGEDLKSTHHPNEIAQTEAITNQTFVKYWLHGAFLQVDGGRMGKSLGNAYSLHDIKNKGFTPEQLRYFYLTGHYRKPLNFTWESLTNAQTTYQKLIYKAYLWHKKADNYDINQNKILKYETQFQRSLANDLNTPQILAILWNMVKDENINPKEKLFLLINWDDIFGFNIEQQLQTQLTKYTYFTEDNHTKIISKTKLSDHIISLINQRELARKTKNWKQADDLRNQISKLGFKILDLTDHLEIISK